MEQNQNMERWNWFPSVLPPFETPMFILVEHCQIYTSGDIPFIRLAEFNEDITGKQFWKLLDAEPSEEEILPDFFVIAAWRFASHTELS